jgi:F-type H+-transporting ATPase subunit epsilon
MLPTEVLVDADAVKVIAEAENGYFCLEPRHVDFAAALVPGVLSLVTTDGQERFVAVDQGVLVKCAGEVLVSTANAVVGDELGSLRALVEERFLELDEHERRARSALARLEAGALRGIRELQERLRG